MLKIEEEEVTMAEPSEKKLWELALKNKGLSHEH